MKKLLVLGTVLAGSVIRLSAYDGYFSNGANDISLYTQFSHYTDSNRDNSVIGGFRYSYNSDENVYWNYKVIIDAKRTYIKYKKPIFGNKEKYFQNGLAARTDFTYNDFVTFGIVGNKIFIDRSIYNETSLSDAWMIGTGISFHQENTWNKLRYDLGVNFYYSKYDRGAYKFRVTQTSPYIGFFIMNPSSMLAKELWGSLYLKIQMDFEHFQKQKDSFAEDGYTSGEATLINKHQDFDIVATLETGKSTYKVTDNGLVMRNLGERTKFQGKIKTDINVFPGCNLGIGYGYQNIQDPGSNKEGHNQYGFLSLDYSF